MKKIYIILLLFLANLSFSQDIISTPFIVNGIVQLGGKAKVQFNINPITVCDSYTIEFDINHFSKIINVNVNYIYNSLCSETTSLFTEFPEKQALLTGVYIVNINLNVLTNPIWNKQIQVGAITVIEPNNISCSNSFIPFLEGVCPAIATSQICACNGETYANECLAYLQDQNGVYINMDCPTYVIANAIQYSCNTFNSENHFNFFEKYNCDSEVNIGNEIIFLYNHTETGPLLIDFTSSSNDVKLYLIALGNDLECLEVSVDNKLEVDDLSIGQYAIIADRSGSGNYSVSFCNDTLSVLDSESNLEISPNPASNYLDVRNLEMKLGSLEILNSNGVLVDTYEINDFQRLLRFTYPSGIYFTRLNYQNGKREIKKLLIVN